MSDQPVLGVSGRFEAMLQDSLTGRSAPVFSPPFTPQKGV